MSRSKINYAAQGMFVGPSPATGSHYLDNQSCYGSGTRVNELYRIQGYSYDFDFNKEGLGQFGNLANLDYLNLTWPNVNLNFNYLLSNFGNEKNLGFIISSGSLVNALSGIIAGNTEDKNYFITIHSPDGKDLHNNPNFNLTSPGAIIGFGNGVITNYSSKAAVGQFPNIDLTLEALNVRVYDKNNSLYSVLMNRNSENAGFDNVTGFDFSNNIFNSWTISLNPSALVKIVPDPINISTSNNSDVLLMSNPITDSYFSASGTGTNWTTSNSFANIFVSNNQLVFRKTSTGSTSGRLMSGNFNYLPQNKWYKANIDIASGDFTTNFKANIAGTASPDFVLRTGLNTIYNTGDSTLNSVISFNYTLTADTGTIYFNKIELCEPMNFSARFYATGSVGSSFNYIAKTSDTNIYNILGLPSTENKRFNLSMDIKYSGFQSNSKQLFYTSIGSNDNVTNAATIRQPLLTSDYENNFKNLTLQISNSPRTNNLFLPELRLIRLFDVPSGELWIDNLKLEQTNITDIVNPNLFNGSFEVYHPNSVQSGVGTITIFSGWETNQNPSYNPYLLITGSSSIPDYDKNVTFSNQSLKATLINPTGASNYLVLYPNNNGYGTFNGKKRHKFSCYTKYSGTSNPTISLKSRVLEDQYYQTSLNTDNSWQYHETEFVPTGTLVPKIEIAITSPVNGDQFWLDDVNLSYYDDCYALPTVETVSGGFNIPINSSTNFSGLETNSNNKSISVLRPKDVYLDINYSDFGPSISDWKLQSYDLNVGIPRENIYQIGQDHPFKKIQNPLQGTLSLNAILGDIVTGNLIDYYLTCNKNYDIKLGIILPCSNETAIEYQIKKACLTSMEFTNTIGDNKSATMNFIFPIGGITETGKGLFMSGIVFN